MIEFHADAVITKEWLIYSGWYDEDDIPVEITGSHKIAEVAHLLPVGLLELMAFAVMVVHEKKAIRIEAAEYVLKHGTLDEEWQAATKLRIAACKEGVLVIPDGDTSTTIGLIFHSPYQWLLWRASRSEGLENLLRERYLKALRITPPTKCGEQAQTPAHSPQ